MGQNLMIRENQLNFVIAPYHSYLKGTKINVSELIFKTHRRTLRHSEALNFKGFYFVSSLSKTVSDAESTL